MHIRRLSPLLLSTAVAACGGPSAGLDATSASASQAIINGVGCDETQEPTAVAILFDGTLDFGTFGAQDITTVLCTGTLIAPDVVLLAAHCLDTTTLTFGLGTVTREEFYVSFEPDLSALAGQSQTPAAIPASALPVRDRVAHEDFDIQTLGEGTAGTESDIALLFLEVTVDDVLPEVVITAEEAEQLAVGTPVTIAGWGQQTADSPGFGQPPPEGSVGIKQCGETTINELGETLMQIGAGSETTRKCHGDSGGPTYVEIDTPSSIKRRVIGVTSRAYDASDCQKGGVDTRVDAFLDFLDDEMATRCEAGTRAWCDVRGLLSAADVEALAGGGPSGEGDGDGDDDDGDVDVAAADLKDAAGCPGCAGSPAEPLLGLALLGLLLPRRRRR